MRTLWLTNDLPPRPGGIEQFVDNLARRTHPGESLVLAPAHPDAEESDAEAPYGVRRLRGGTLLPTPGILRATRAAAAEHDPDVVVLGATWPLGELAPALARDPGVPVVALTHGLEAGLVSVRAGWLVRRASRRLDAATVVSDYTGEVLEPWLAADVVRKVPPGVDVGTFHPDRSGDRLRRAWGVPLDVPLVGCIARLVPRKGQDVLLDAWPEIRERVPDAWLVVVGTGRSEDRLRRRGADLGGVVVTGPVTWTDLPDAYAALDLFVMPSRTRLGGLLVEGLGISYLEAQACGVPVVAGRSGGAPETVLEGRSGLVVDGTSARDVAAAVIELLADPARRERFGKEGRVWTEEQWGWEVVAARFRELLEEACAGVAG